MADTINLKDALDALISATNIKERDQCLEDIKHVLTYNRNKPSLTDLKPAAFAEIFSRLGDAITTLQSTWWNAPIPKTKKPKNGSGTRAKTASHLTACSTAMRMAVEAGARTIRFRTVKSLLDHILETLPNPDGQYCEPIAADYIRCLRILLEFPPHVEHLTRREWNIIVEFCLDGVAALATPSQPANGHSSNETPRMQTPDPSAESTARSFARDSGSSQRHNTGSHLLVDNLVGCLRFLASATNAPLMDQASALISTLTDFLCAPRSAAVARVDALVTVNVVLSRTYLDSTSCAQGAIRNLIPVMRTFWSTKLASLRDEMLITLIFSRAHIRCMLHEKDADNEDLRIGLENLIEAMHTEYVKRIERDQLQIEDLRLRCSKEYPYEDTPFSLPVFRLKPGNFRSEHSWVLLYFVTDLACALESSRPTVWDSFEPGNTEAPSKKRRRSDYLQDHLRQLSSPQPSTRLSSLHVIAFMVQQVRLTAEEVRFVLEKLISKLSDGNSAISNWAMLGTASCAVQSVASSPELKSLWTTAWQLSSRNVTTGSTCRTASHVMDIILRLGLVDYRDIGEIADVMVSSTELHGPAVLSDSSCSLWLTIFDARSSESPHSSHVTTDRMLRWLFSRWTPSNFHDRAHINQNSRHYDAWDIVRMLLISTDRSPPPHFGRPFSNLGPLAIATLRANQCPQLVEYLLLPSSETDFLRVPRSIVGSTSAMQRNQSSPADHLIWNYCSTEVEKTLKRFEEFALERAQSFSSDMIRTISILCIVCSQLPKSPRNDPSERTKGIDRLTSALSNELAKFIGRQDCDQFHVDAVMEAVAPCLPKVSTLGSVGSDLFDELGISSLVCFIAVALEDRYKSKGSMDLMDVDEEFDSQKSSGIAKGDVIDIPRDELTAQLDPNSMRLTFTATLQLLSCAAKRVNNGLDDSRGSDAFNARIPEDFRNYIDSLSASEFLMCNRLLSDILASSLQLSAEDGELFLHSAAGKLEDYEYERSEVAIGLCVDLMSGTIMTWTEKKSSGQSLGTEIYEWLITKLLKAGSASAAVQIKVANLFQRLLQFRPEYAADLKLPSVRTSLFSLLKDGNVLVQFRIIDSLSEVFGFFVLSQHESIFEDVHENLPSNQDSPEEMALRLLGFARLGAAWHTLLRRCVYHIFETAGLITESAGHAARCIQMIAKSLRLESPRLVFKLFASQLLYTWMGGEQKIKDIPYSIFGYESLAILMKDLQEELYGQIAMRNDHDELPVLLDALNVSQKDLAQRNFSKAAAYAIAWDQCRNRGSTFQNNEKALRELFGDHYYKALLGQQFPSVLAVLISTMEEVDLAIKSIEKHPEFQNVRERLIEMREMSSSEVTLPADLQPNFQARYIFDEIKRLCRRTGYDHARFWTPDCFVFVLRYLLDKIHPALGSLHACSIIRKIRFLVALAGPIALQGYPLQMALGSLRPFLTDAQCADDTLGIVRYLLQYGRPQLMDQLSFVAGNSISILIALRVFLSSTQDSTTQETQHTETMRKAQDFDKWFNNYLESYVKELMNATNSRSGRASLELFQSMVRAARDVRTAGNAVKGSPESNLLMALLRDEASEKRLLNGPSQNLAYSLLCREFNVPSSFRQDLLGDASLAAKFATQIWKSSQRSNNSKQYLLWSARVLGRSYSATGEIQENLRKAAREGNGGANLRTKRSKSSRMLIVESLAVVTQGDEPHKAGIVEHTLRDILSEKDHEDSTGREQLEEVKQVLPEVLTHGLTMNGAFRIPLLQPDLNKSIEETAYPQKRPKLASWISELCILLAKSTVHDRVINALPKCLAEIQPLSEELYPYVLHLALERDLDGDGNIRQAISDAYRKWFQQRNEEDVPYLKVLLRSILYIRTQPFPRERNIADRIHWLDIDFLDASNAAVKSGMYRAALLLAEMHVSQPAKTSRRSSVLPLQESIPLQLQLSIYENLDEPDSFYGAEQEPSLESVLNRLDYESDGFKGLLFHGAKMDSEMRRLKTISPSDSSGIVRDLAMLNLNSLTHAISTNDDFRNTGNNLNYTLEVAQKLEQWDIRAPPASRCEAAAVYRTFQGVSTSTDLNDVRRHIDEGFLDTIETCKGLSVSTKTLQSSLRTFSILNEIDEIMTADNTDELMETWRMVKDRVSWMKEARMEDVRPILSARETLFSILSKTSNLQNIIHTGPRQLREQEADAHISASDIYRKHGALQELLSSATYLADIVPKCREVGYNVENIAKYQVSLVLWDQGEKNTSIRMLQQLENETKSSKDVTVARSVLLTKLGQYTAEARLKKPEEIMKQYMEPAIRELKSNRKGELAGQAYHAFASFCDQQLQSPDLIEDENRMRLLAERREADAVEYDRLAATNKAKNARDYYRQQARKARKWFNMDMQEAQKLGDSRVAFLRQSLENYLLALQACDEYDNDVFRMCSLWLEYSGLPLANNAVSKYIQPVPSGKFVVLMNQLSSRLQDESSDFQQILSALVFRICKDHPYHGMNHIYAGSNNDKLKDETAKSRNAAAKSIGRQLKADKASHDIWDRITKANTVYNDLAMFVDQSMFKMGKDYEMRRYPYSKKLIATIPDLKVPPITMDIPVNNSGDYRNVPKVSGFKPTMGIANGLSQPKTVTAIATNGRLYKQLYKSGNDDLRQDAIMEQVFEHVSLLLRSHTATRLRNLNIRTYKVVPLSHRSGVIEFVQNTMPLMNYLDVAHKTYFPKDMEQNTCRKKIAEIATHNHEERLKVYREVCRNFHPVLRYFFLERFEDPDDWFEKRLAYTRSTAAISILGHVLGLGDRHCHNILLDQQSGEAVHIDLGVAFEAGRVLPVPEVVPFRLTRDLVDAMGYSGVEGVFRRCCEFTLDTLRDERDSIMTILNVLRYDPLYSWSVSPLKAKKMQEAAAQNEAAAAGGDGKGGDGGTTVPDNDLSGVSEEQEQRFLLELPNRRKKDEEVQGEAGRALSVVERKLSKALSSAAAVAELIQQATDERNLAVLYAGWSAWC
ncbi:hypothetical protein B0J12DRAFT_643289 [Macrophomina phaseolina]|uniref:Serine/threonine-protein kinase Tel1 n=1 Tax=Macrophomina phaseolina TaxID=35725 RepID=A0ABQ8GSX4_9PEZI|nr:hypothetical protein B0J12DRAFT_643289 [Macrophomina phaseolina]